MSKTNKKEIILDLVKKNEGDKLDFKAFYKHDIEGKNEIIKDMISLANGSITSIGKESFLIIGFNEKTSDFIDIQVLEPNGDRKNEGKIKDELTQVLVNYTDKPLTFNLSFQEIEKGKQIILIEIQSHPYLICLSKDLKTPTKIISKGSLIYRENATVDIATREIRDEFIKQINILNEAKILNKEKISRNYSNVYNESNSEIELKARDILSLIVSQRDSKNLSNNLGFKLKGNEKIHYEYYYLKKKENTEGYLFLAKNVTAKNVLQHFCDTYKNELPDRLEIFILKKTANTKSITKEYVENIVKNFNLGEIVKSEYIYILEDFVWENTIFLYHFDRKRRLDNFIDQKLFKIENSQSSMLPQESIRFFTNEIKDGIESPLSIVYGSGGVGKTTFCETLQSCVLNEQDSKRIVFLIKGENIVKNYISSDSEVNTLNDLIELGKKDFQGFEDFPDEYFRLNFILGNIIVVIDAIEEIASSMGERFNLISLFESIKKFHKRFLNARVIITTRQHFSPKIDEAKEIFEENELFPKINFYRLEGFEQSDLEEYLFRKYKYELKVLILKDINELPEHGKSEIFLAKIKSQCFVRIFDEFGDIVLKKKQLNIQNIVFPKITLEKVITDSVRKKKYLNSIQDKFSQYILDESKYVPKQITQVIEIIKENRLFQKGHVIPLFVLWVCHIVDKSRKNNKRASQINSNFLVEKIPIDRLFSLFLLRENDKQSLNVEIDNFIEIIKGVVIDFNGIMPMKDFDLYVDSYSGAQSSENFLRSPLFKLTTQNEYTTNVQLNYDILPNFIRARFLRYTILYVKDYSDKILNQSSLILKDGYQGQGEVFCSLVESLTEEPKQLLLSKILILIKLYRCEIKNIDKKSILEIEKLKRSISSLLYILESIFKPESKKARTQLISKAYNAKKKIDGLYIYGEFRPLDLSDIVVINSNLFGYTNFSKCKFPDEKKLIFLNTEFKNFNIPKTKGILSCFFDSSCSFSRCNVKIVTEIASEAKLERSKSIRRDIISLVNYIDMYHRSLHLISRYTHIEYPQGLKFLLEKLVNKRFLEFNINNKKLYCISEEFVGMISSIKINEFPEELELIVDQLI